MRNKLFSNKEGTVSLETKVIHSLVCPWIIAATGNIPCRYWSALVRTVVVPGFTVLQ